MEAPGLRRGTQSYLSDPSPRGGRAICCVDRGLERPLWSDLKRARIAEVL